MNHSNRLIINDRSTELPRELLSAGITSSNYRDDWHHRICPHFRAKPRKKHLDHLVLHETAGNSATGCIRTLQRKRYGVHLIIWGNGHISNHLDLMDETGVHANQCNKTSVGIEIVNPYAPSLVKPIWGIGDFLSAQWWTWCPDKKDRRYVLPHEAQLKTLRYLIPWLCDYLDIPYKFPTRHLNNKQRKIKRWWLRRKPGRGVVAHRDFGRHADGRYPLEQQMEQKETHIWLKADDGTTYGLPAYLVQEWINGDKKISGHEDWEIIVRAILADWVEEISRESCH